MSKNIRLSSGPLQGFTDAIFRKTHQELWGGIDDYYGPYLRLDAHKEPKKSQVKDIKSTLNSNIPYVPQLMANNAKLIIENILWLKELGYKHVNWNLGCPYPMVTKRNMGAGLLNQNQLVKSILEEIMPQMPLEFSIKCRLGMHQDDEILTLIDVFNSFNLREIIIHARTAEQMYKGNAQPNKVWSILKLSKNPIAYNGDIFDLDTFNDTQSIFGKKIEHFMLGRGLLIRPYLANQIKGQKYENDKLQQQLLKFHDVLIEQYGKKLQNHQLFMKMRSFWEYFAQGFSNSHKVYKLIKKSGNMRKYDQTVDHIFQTFEIQSHVSD